MFLKRTRQCVIFIISMLFVLLCGCGARELPNTYVEGSDFQYMQWGNDIAYVKVQQAEGGCYFFYEGYLYYLDEGTNVILPLCNKADCLHDKEPDYEKRTFCNAFIGGVPDNVGIAWCNGYLYCLVETELIRCSPDGSHKETFYQWGHGAAIEQWIIHRDVLYYVEHKYRVDHNTVKDMYAINALSLTETVKQPQPIYLKDEHLNIKSLNYPMAYGNYLYFQVIGFTASDDLATDEQFTEYLYVKTFIYNLTDGQLNEVTIPGLSKYEVIQGVNFWKDKIIFSVYDFLHKDNETTALYSADLDGTNPEVLMEEYPRYGIMTDGQYLYLTNSGKAYESGEEILYMVFNHELELIDTFQLPFRSYYAKAMGTPQRAYWPFYYGEESQKQGKAGFGLMCWDKSKIGAYNGGTVEVEYIVR